MKSILLSVLFIVAYHSSTFCQVEETAGSEELQKWIAKDKASTRAQKDEVVLIALAFVKGESKTEFDAWVKDVLYAALYKSKSEMKKAQLKATRWLEPTQQNEDGTWTYAWIMDPIIPNTLYDIPKFLNQEYGEALGKKHMEAFLSYMARPAMDVFLKQTDY